MGFTYDATLAANLSRVRFLLQDTTNTTARPNLLDDGEITWALSVEANIYMAAALCADSLATRFRGVKSKSVGGLSISYDVSQGWTEVAKRLRTRGSLHQILTAGGVLRADRDAIWEDTDLLRPAVFSTLFEDPLGPSPSRRSDLSEEELP